MSCRKRITAKWKSIPGFSRNNSHKNKTRSRDRSRRREMAKKIFKTPIINGCNPLPSFKKSTLTPQTSRSSQISYPTLPREVPFLQNDSTRVTHRSSTPDQLSLNGVPLIGLTNEDDDLCPPTPTPASRRLPINSGRSRKYKYRYIDFNDPIGERDIDTKIFHKLMKGPGQLKSSAPLGHVYCSLREQTPGYIKIGSTKRDPSVREKELSPNKQFGTLTHTTSALFTHFQLVERVLQLELWNQRKESKIEDVFVMNTCERSERKSITGSPKGKTESGRTEWFHIEASHADEVRDKWVTWARQNQPYNQDGELKAFWSSWFKRQMERNSYCRATHGSLHLRWKALLNPTQSEIRCHYMIELWETADRNRGVTFFVILSIALLCLPRIWLVCGVPPIVWYFLSCNDSSTKTK